MEAKNDIEFLIDSGKMAIVKIEFERRILLSFSFV